MDPVPVIARGNNAAVLLAPVTEALQVLLRAVPGRPILLLAGDRDRALELALGCGIEGAVVATAGSRASAAALGSVPALAVSAADALDLVGRSNLHPAEFRAVVLAWPEELDQQGAEALGAVMAECDREAQRLVVVAACGPQVERLVERYAFKAMTFGFPEAEPAREGAAAAPPPHLGAAQYVIAPASRLAEWRLLIADALDPAAPRPVAACPATRAEAAALAAAGQPVLVLAYYQLRWARTLFEPLTPFPVPGAVAGLERNADRLRSRVGALAEAGDLERELLILGPLFDRFDPAVVAAAALRLASARGDPAPLAASAAGAGGRGAAPTYARLWVGIGRKDGVKPGDLVGALANEAGVPADAIGRIELRDLFCLVDVRSDHADQAVRRLTGVTVRGRRVVARIDRGPGQRRGSGIRD